MLNIFSGYSRLTSIEIPEGVASIRNQAFYDCISLQSVTIPESVTVIGNGTFEGCEGLTSITIPSSVTSIGQLAFEGCEGLTSITAYKMEPSEYNCGASVFYNVPSSVTLYVPSGCASAYRALEPWSNFSNIVEIDLTSIQQIPTLNPSAAIIAYYNLQGQRITNPQRGQLVIVRYADGTSRKVVVD